MTTEEGTHTLPDGQQLYTKTWKPNEPPRAVLAFVHGFSDHCNNYCDFFSSLASVGLEVRAFDQRGWGQSVKTRKDRGNTGDTAQVLSDMHSFLTSVAAHAEAANTPLFLAGHSMGGGQVLTYILHPESPYHTASKPKLSGALVWGPLITLDPSTQPWKITLVAGRLAARVLPRLQRHTPLDPELISRDKQVVENYKADKLCHDTGTLEGLKGMLDRGLWLDEAGVDVYERAGLLPLWVGHGVCDRVTGFEGTKAFVERLGAKGDVTFCPYEGAFHTLHAELPETTGKFVKDFSDWMVARCPSVTGGVSGLGQSQVESGQQDEPILGETEAESGNKSKL